MALNPYQKYQQQSVMTMTPGEMLTRLFDELIKQLSAFKEYNSQKDYAQANDALQRAQRILRHLDATLDRQYEVSHGLSALYDYFIRRTVEANLRKDDAPIDEILPMVTELRDSFIQADRLADNPVNTRKSQLIFSAGFL